MKNAKIILPKLKIKQLVKYNGTPCYLAGITGNSIVVHNGVEFYTDNKIDEYVNALLKLSEMKKNGAILGDEEKYIVKTNREGVEKLVVDKTQNLNLYKMLVERLEIKQYSGLSSMATFKNNLNSMIEKFTTLSTYNQVETLLQIIRFFKCNAETSNLTLIDGSANSGKVLFNKDIAFVDFRIIHQSPCGLTQIEQKI